uniref:Uncharacterized protein n=1 Tax=Ananas comosus var. bracteatus TaxID=296719 RepID=A0A6V7QQI4_ANACO
MDQPGSDPQQTKLNMPAPVITTELSADRISEVAADFSRATTPSLVEQTLYIRSDNSRAKLPPRSPMANSRSPSPFFVVLFGFFLFLIYSMSDVHRNWTPQGSKRSSPKKSDHLILGDAPGQGLPNRLECDGLKAMNKIDPSNENLNSSERVSFVTVFTVYNSDFTGTNEKLHDVVTVGNIAYSKVDRSMAILGTFIKFIQVSMPRSSVIILTDPASKFSINHQNAILLPIPGDYSRESLMVQRIRSYIAFLGKRLEENESLEGSIHFIFTDSDIAVVDDVGHIFQKYPNFHLALTFRNNKYQPINSGFIAVRGTLDGITKAKIFLQEVLDAYNTRYTKAYRMLGDQLSLVSVVKSHLPLAFQKFSRQKAFAGEVNGVIVQFLPCAVYNWTPPEGAGQFHGMPLDVQVVHFKGSRKRLMLESWNYFNSTSSRSNMLCLILRSGRTKYDF